MIGPGWTGPFSWPERRDGLYGWGGTGRSRGMGGSWWVTEALAAGGPVYVYSWVVIVVGSIVLHELGHGWMAIRLGDRTPLETGHMTWNPVVHMGMYSLVVFALIGIAWGMMPVD